MIRLQDFDLEGISYTQQYRRCGKPTCHTCSEGQGHGPYWYARDQQTGTRTYHGKDLPAAIVAALEATRGKTDAIQEAMRHALGQYEALRRLLHAAPLADADRRTLAALGFGACLVYSTRSPATQDGLTV